MSKHPVHPGEVIRDRLTRRNMTQAALARESGITQKHVSRIITHQSGVGPIAAFAIGGVLDIDPKRLLRLQADYDIANSHNPREPQR